jgi:hypothetical protein
MKTSIFIRTYAGDIMWLAHCLASLRKYAHGHHEIVIAAPQGDYNKVKSSVDTRGCKLVECYRTAKDDYIGQQITKVHADAFCDTELILHIDSDCVAHRNFNVSEFCTDSGQPMMTFRNWGDAGTAACWRQPTEEVLGIPPAFEFMAQLPIIHRAATLRNFREHVVRRHQDSAYLENRHAFSEFNAIGAFAHYYHPDEYHWVRATGPCDGYPRPLKQFWSKGGFTPEIDAEIARFLA